MCQLSIITVNYNNLKGLQKTMMSISSQTFEEYEWIIIDGGSTDGSKEEIEQLASVPDNHVSYWCSQPDNGVYNAMNKGIAQSHGQYLCFMNSGDCFCNASTLADVFSSHHEATIVFGDWIFETSEGDVKVQFPYPFELYDFYIRNICHQAMFILGEWHKKHLYDESYKILADYKNWAQAAVDGCSFEHVPYTICRCEDGGLSNRPSQKLYLEQKKVKSEMWPLPVLTSIHNLHDFRSDFCINKVRELLSAGGYRARILRFIIRHL